MPLSDREYRYWITQNCPRQNCWIVMARLGEMISHPGTTVYGPDGGEQELKLKHDNLKYVYFAHFDKNRVTTLVQDTEAYYLIDNEQLEDSKEATVKSVIHCGTNLAKILEHVTGARKKAIGLKSRDKAKLTARQVQALRGVTYIDFINMPKAAQMTLWERYIFEHRDGRLDLSGFTMLEPDILQSKPMSYRELVLYQNNLINSFSWLGCIKGLKTLSIWFNNSIQDTDIAAIAEAVPMLEVFEVHSCMSLTGRALLPLSQMRMLNKLVINNTGCRWQEKSYETVIRDQEWEAIDNTNLQVLLIDSYNLTLDVIAFILRAFKALQNFIMCPEMLEKLDKNSAPGYLDEKVTFHSAENLQQCFSRRRDIRVFDLVRNKCGNTFSDSMLKKIRELDPSKGDAADTLQANRLKTYI
jgi:hypothetical protein